MTESINPGVSSDAIAKVSVRMSDGAWICVEAIGDRGDPRSC